MTTFNLVHQPWIPVLAGGSSVTVTLTDALTRADELDGLGVEEPLQTVAVLRQVLLPVLLDACDAPRSEGEWAARWEAGILDRARITDYLAEHDCRFDLFDAQRPFAQVAGLHTSKNDTKPVSLLLPALASGNNVPLFSSRTEADPPALTPGQAALAVLSAHCWDTAAIKSGAVGDPKVAAGKTTGNPTGPVGQLGVVIPMGENLARTLLLNCPVRRDWPLKGDRPQWRADPAGPGWADRPALGLLDLLTWQSRRIRLFPDIGAGGETVIRRVVVAAGDRLDHIPHDVELHTMWRRDDKPKAGQQPQRPVRHQPGKEAWRGLGALLATKEPTADKLSSSLLLGQLADLRAEGDLSDDVRLQVLMVGVAYGNQSAVVEEVMADLLPLPIAALLAGGAVREVLHVVAGQAEDLRQAANHLGDALRRAGGGSKVAWDQGQRLGDTLIHEFTPYVQRLVAGLSRQPGLWEAADDAWRRTARRLALAVLERAMSSVGPSTFAGRGGSDPAEPVATAEARYRMAVRRILGTALADGPTPAELVTAGGRS